MIDLFGLFVNQLADAVFPHRCVCGRWGEVLCSECLARLGDTSTEVCPYCKKLSGMGRVCGACKHKSSLTGVMVLGPHRGVLKDSIWKLKYGPIKAMAEPLATVLVEKYGEFLQNKNAAVSYVPTSLGRLRQRGYNQAAELARIFAANTDLELISTMERPKDTLHQVGLSRSERLENVRGTVTCTGGRVHPSKRIVVFDDVYTTGATLEECAKVLRQAGYREVWGVVLSRD